MDQKDNKICDDNVCLVGEEANGEEVLDLAPALDVSEWLNLPQTGLFDLANYRGKVVVISAFQMLCPFCVTEALPQTQRLYERFRSSDEVVVLGLHTVFEHHNVMNREALATFLAEFRYDFPVGIDRHFGNGRIPETMKRYRLRGTPSLIIIDKQGRLNEVLFGGVEDLVLGVKLGKLVAG